MIFATIQAPFGLRHNIKKLYIENLLRKSYNVLQQLVSTCIVNSVDNFTVLLCVALRFKMTVMILSIQIQTNMY